MSDIAKEYVEGLRARIAELEAENARLTAEQPAVPPDREKLADEIVGMIPEDGITPDTQDEIRQAILAAFRNTELEAAVLAEREEFKHFIAEANLPDEVRRDLYRRIRARPTP